MVSRIRGVASRGWDPAILRHAGKSVRIVPRRHCPLQPRIFQHPRRSRGGCSSGTKDRRKGGCVWRWVASVMPSVLFEVPLTDISFLVAHHGESTIKVTGPSLTSSTSIIAPKIPSCTRIPRRRTAATKSLYRATATSGAAEPVNDGRFPLRQSP